MTPRNPGEIPPGLRPDWQLRGPVATGGSPGAGWLGPPVLSPCSSASATPSFSGFFSPVSPSFSFLLRTPSSLFPFRSALFWKKDR